MLVHGISKWGDKATFKIERKLRNFKLLKAEKIKQRVTPPEVTASLEYSTDLPRD